MPLVDLEQLPVDDIISMIVAGAEGGWRPPEHKETGIYEITHFNSGHQMKDKEINAFKNLTGCKQELKHGVVDNIEQVVKALEGVNEFVVVFVTKVTKSSQSETGGWRWYRWGPYIGTKNPQFEYLIDEGPDIEEIFVFHIHEVKEFQINRKEDES